MWKSKEDNSDSVITAEKHIKSCRKGGLPVLPETAVLFYMHSGVDYTMRNFKSRLLTDRLPCFLNSRPIYQIKGSEVCFLHGGWGAPMAADTVETLAALGVKNIVSVGMFGAFGENVSSGDVVVPYKAFSEEGTSLHYYENEECFFPDSDLHIMAKKFIKAESFPIVSTDAVYRQTFYKEQLWREKGAVGVDMETSAVFSVGKYTGINAVSVLIASDKHPLSENGKAWEWTMTAEQRYALIEKCINFALEI